jgi:hypothetical protein
VLNEAEDPENNDWVLDGRNDIARFAYNGLGIELHAKQIEVLQAVLAKQASYYFLDWANRAGKTLTLCVMHMHQLWYKPFLVAEDYNDWKKTEYATLHTAPLNELAGKAHFALSEIIKGVSLAQKDPETGKRRPSPLAPLYVAIKERDAAGADHMVLRCVPSRAKTDFRSTEGGGARLEGSAWWLITWDEWPATEGDPEGIRTILNTRLTNRAADFGAPIVLTGTRTPDTEHIAKEFENWAEDPEEKDWWGSHAARAENPAANKESIARAARLVAAGKMDVEDYNRTVLGIEGGVKGRLIPRFLVDRLFTDLPRFTPPERGDGWGRQDNPSKWTYLHVWDLAIAAADNIGAVFRVPRDWDFSTANPIVGVQMKRIPGSRTLTSAEIIHTIEETFLPYGGKIVVDTTDAHGKNIHRELRAAGYPVEDFTFNERPGIRGRPMSPLHNIIRKDRAIKALLTLLGDGLDFKRDKAGEPVMDAEQIVKLDLGKVFGSIRLPNSWTVFRDQVSLLRPDDARQRKDAAMVLLMMADVALRNRRARNRPSVSTPFAVFTGS